MQRGDIIDRLISVKKTQEVGSAFRPAREADMMRRLAQRHRGILPLDTVESIWRVIISTFTYVQAPFSLHADLSGGESAMRDSARFHFGFTVPFLAHFSAAAAVDAVAKSKGDLALVSATSSRRAVVADAWIHRARRRSSRACRSSNAPTIPRPCRCSLSRASLPMRWSPKSKCGASAFRAGVLTLPVRCRPSPRLSLFPTPPPTAQRCWCPCRGPARLGQNNLCADRSRGIRAFLRSRRGPRNTLYGATKRRIQSLRSFLFGV